MGGAMGSLIGIGNITVRCTNQGNSKNEIQLWCNMEKLACSSMEASREIITIERPSVQQSYRKYEFRVRLEGAQNSAPAIYRCQTEDQDNIPAVTSVPDLNTPAMFLSDREEPRSNEYKTKEGNKSQKCKNKNKPKKNNKKNTNKKLACKDDSSEEEDRKSDRDPKLADGGGEETEDENEGDMEQEEEEEEEEEADGVLYAVIALLVFILLILAVCSALLWKNKKKSQGTLKAGGATDQVTEKKVVTVYAKTTHPGTTDLPPIYNATGHIYQEITDTPQNSSEMMHNPLYTSSDHPSPLQLSGSQDPPLPNGQYSPLQLPANQ
ncbi:uncharacterized protein [Pyxicephalus adspersus]|uniref:uncharacterized protein n=1 Tax=Pyxicephalus adspersus TaxID=30357 RepID=UPI003B5B283C